MAAIHATEDPLHLAISTHLTISDSIVVYIILAFYIGYYTFGGISDFIWRGHCRTGMRWSQSQFWLGMIPGSRRSLIPPFYLGNIFVKDTSLDRSAHILIVSFISLFLADTQFAFGDNIKSVAPAISIFAFFG